jgi:two-component system chemotaxis response regulator CheY
MRPEQWMKSVLIVDDPKVVRMVARKILQEMQFDIAEAADGQQALDACRTGMPDVVLLDWNMPVMNGIDFLRALRADPGGDKPVVIFCTTENDLQHIQLAIMEGANEYIMKPFDAEILKTKLEQTGVL